MHTHRPIQDDLRLEGTGVPIYVQLREQLLAAIGDGRLKPGDQMPTMRQLAVALKVDLNTVRHAYDDLDRAGAIRLERGRGSFVADAPPPADPPARAAQIENLARQTLALAASQGVDPLALAERLLALVSPPRASPQGPNP